MQDELRDIRIEVKQLLEMVKELRHNMTKLMTIAEFLEAAGIQACVTLAPEDCHTFNSAPSGKLTVENSTNQAGAIQMKWANDVFEGEVQQTSTRIVQPMAWPAEICNTGDVPLKVCPA